MGEVRETADAFRVGSGRIEGMQAWTNMVCMALWLRQKEDEVPRRERAEIAMGVSFRVKVHGGCGECSARVRLAWEREVGWHCYQGYLWG